MTPRRTHPPPLAWRTLLRCACAGLLATATLAVLDLPAALATGKGRPTGHHPPSPEARVPARPPAMPTGPHPGESMRKQTFTPKPL
ncbi:hypothetical protein ACV229_21590 [Burkholderia sp. MR1-5-21]